MAYTRGEIYIWSDGEQLHLWSSSGMDDWQEMDFSIGNPNASGLKIPELTADEFAVMRFAEIVLLGETTDVVERTLKLWKGNFGCVALEKLSEQIIKFSMENGNVSSG